MTGAGINDGDLLVVDRGVTPVHGKVVVAMIGGDMTVKRLNLKTNPPQLDAANSTYKSIKEAFEIWEIVTASITEFYIMFALVDFNSFYASCERVFRPGLNGKPVVVFSSNYALYGDLFARVMKVLEAYTSALEVYSIDEAFLSLKGFKGLGDKGKLIKYDVERLTGVPVSVGIALTKTLEKLVNHVAKRFEEHCGSCYMKSPDVDILKQIKVGKVWGWRTQSYDQMRRYSYSSWMLILFMTVSPKKSFLKLKCAESAVLVFVRVCRGRCALSSG